MRLFQGLIFRYNRAIDKEKDVFYRKCGKEAKRGINCGPRPENAGNDRREKKRMDERSAWVDDESKLVSFHAVDKGLYGMREGCGVCPARAGGSC